MDDLGRWEPLPLVELVGLMSEFDARWWIAGGHALELHLERSWRLHGDIDAGICRTDVARLRGLLTGWEVFVAAAGELTPWSGFPLAASLNQNNLWVRRPGGPWRVDVTVGAGNEHDWVYRRDSSLRMPWDAAVLASRSGVPYLAPALQLLFKGKNVRPKDQLDAEVVIPELDPWSLDLLDARLHRNHPWRTLIREHRDR